MPSIEGEIVKSRSIEGEPVLPIGITPNIQVGATTTLEPGLEAFVELDESSTRLNPVFNFGIPTGVDGTDYVITEDDYAAIEKQVMSDINPVLEDNLQEAKEYANSIKPTKTSELINDSKFAVTDQNNNFSTSQTINGTLTINGDIVQNGESYTTHAEEVHTKNDEIITREGAVGGLSEGQYAGIRATLYDGTNNGRLGFNAAGEARVGDIGDEQPLLTRDEITNLQTGQVLVWDGTTLRAVGSNDYVKNTDMATSTKAGLIKLGPRNTGLQYDPSGYLKIVTATKSDIDGKQNIYNPITPGFLDYAVKSVVGGHETLTQTEYDELVANGTYTKEDGTVLTYSDNDYYNIVEE